MVYKCVPWGTPRTLDIEEENRIMGKDVDAGNEATVVMMNVPSAG